MRCSYFWYSGTVSCLVLFSHVLCKVPIVCYFYASILKWVRQSVRASEKLVSRLCPKVWALHVNLYEGIEKHVNASGVSIVSAIRKSSVFCYKWVHVIFCRAYLRTYRAIVMKLFRNVKPKLWVLWRCAFWVLFLLH